MELGKTLTIKIAETGPYFLVPIGDIHFGNEACDKALLAKDIAWIHNEPRALWIGMGDYAEFIGFRDSRFDPTVIDKALAVADLGDMGQELYDQIASAFAPIADKCVGLLYGNHEDHWQNTKQCHRMHGRLCKEIGVQDLGYSCLQAIDFRMGRKRARYIIRAHHGAGWAVSPGGVLNRLIKFMDQTTADITLVGHLHQKIVVPSKIRLHFDGQHLTQRVHFGCMTGTYLRTYQEGVTTYAEKRGYDPTPLGCHRIPLQPFDDVTIGDAFL